MIVAILVETRGTRLHQQKSDLLTDPQILACFLLRQSHTPLDSTSRMPVAQVSGSGTGMICWLNDKKLIPNGKYVIKHTTKEARCIVKEVRYKVDINTLHKIEDEKSIGLNDIGRILIRTTSPLYYDSYKKNRTTGSVIIIDEFTNETLAAGMII